MTGDPAKAQEAFQSTLRAAAAKTAEGEPPPDRLWFFRDARWQSLIASESGLQPEPGTVDETELNELGAKQVRQLSPEQLAIWISGAPEPQRGALAAYYLDEFTLRELQSLLELKPNELAMLIDSGRRQFQAWLDVTTPVESEED